MVHDNNYILTYVSHVFVKGKRWEFVWGVGSKEYSEGVIRSYICRQTSQGRTDRQFNVAILASIHARGSSSSMISNADLRAFGREVASLIHTGKLAYV